MAIASTNSFSIPPVNPQMREYWIHEFPSECDLHRGIIFNRRERINPRFICTGSVDIRLFTFAHAHDSGANPMNYSWCHTSPTYPNSLWQQINIVLGYMYQGIAFYYRMFIAFVYIDWMTAVGCCSPYI